ncbi:MAG: glycosyltransferase family 2 protein [Proteobacteria bacterium]|uniref:glycosyltransferase family 2 protein n=1 Tax=Aquabacterium sp. TaxID=1872578 RepID=UPI0035C7122F|nr:glycosyltransferase family 2 protein [Pseudomonadota bacterium]
MASPVPVPSSAPTSAASPPAPLPSLGVVIVNYCTCDLTLRCVASMLQHGIAQAEHIVVVDNDSPDGSGARLQADLPPGVVTVLSARNGGFGAGVNIGMAALGTDLVLVLNPDTYFESNRMDVIRNMFNESQKLGVAGLKLVNPDGSLQYSARRFYSLPDILVRRTPLGKLAPMRQLEHSHLLTRKWRQPSQTPFFEADWVMGTGFVVRRSAFEQIGRMDEGYFLYFEEVDLCARMWIEGWQVVAVPEVALVHDHQRSSAAGILSPAGKTHLRSMARFFAKFGVPWLSRPSRAHMAAALARWQASQHGRGPVTEPQHGG